eukprot:Skav219711  [mRNA]  locus=scaffold776:216658:218739:- [translate_table: standard]
MFSPYFCRKMESKQEKDELKPEDGDSADAGQVKQQSDESDAGSVDKEDGQADADESVYGRRDAAISGIAVIHQDRANIYKRSSLWKQGVVDDIQMLPRAEMFKEENAASDHRTLCASVVLDQRPDHLQQYLANAVYEAARAGDLSLHGFPNFETYTQGLRDAKPEQDVHQYQVCVKRGTSLVALGTYANKWLQSETFQTEAKQILDQHNKEFNPDGDFVEEPEDRTFFFQTWG